MSGHTDDNKSLLGELFFIKIIEVDDFRVFPADSVSFLIKRVCILFGSTSLRSEVNP